MSLISLDLGMWCVKTLGWYTGKMAPSILVCFALKMEDEKLGCVVVCVLWHRLGPEHL